MRTVVIVNPRAGSGAAVRQWPEISRRLAATIGPFETWRTTRPGDAQGLVARALGEGALRVIAAGGDGTFSEVVDGWFDADSRSRSEAAVLGLLPFGTGGDFRKTIGLRTLDDALGALAAGARVKVDVGRVRYVDHDGRPVLRHYLNIGGFGNGGLVDAYANQTPHAVKQALGGRLTFMVATARATLRYTNQRVRLRVDGGPPEEHRIYHVAMANGQFLGGGMRIAPDAKLDDGRMDLVILGDFKPLEIAIHSHKIYKGTHLELPKVSFRRVSRIDAEPIGDERDPVLLEIDGESPGRLPATFDVVPGALTLAIPQRVARLTDGGPLSASRRQDGAAMEGAEERGEAGVASPRAGGAGAAPHPSEA